MTLSRTFTYKTFNPNTNDFDKSYKTCYKEVDKHIERKYKAYTFLFYLCASLVFPLLLFTISFACIADTYYFIWAGILSGVGLIAIGTAIYLAVFTENKRDAIEDEFRDTAFDQEDIECGEYNEEQKVIANQWRKEHPFEEKIRMAKTRGSSVDIAEMVKEYIKLQKGE